MQKFLTFLKKETNIFGYLILYFQYIESIPLFPQQPRVFQLYNNSELFVPFRVPSFLKESGGQLQTEFTFERWYACRFYCSMV